MLSQHRPSPTFNSSHALRGELGYVAESLRYWWSSQELCRICDEILVSVCTLDSDAVDSESENGGTVL